MIKPRLKKPQLALITFIFVFEKAPKIPIEICDGYEVKPSYLTKAITLQKAIENLANFIDHDGSPDLIRAVRDIQEGNITVHIPTTD